MHQYIKVFTDYFTQNPPGTGDCQVKSLLEKLSCCYRESRGGDSQRVRSGFDRLDALLNRLSVQEQDQIVEITCGLCCDYQEEAFEDGLVTGFHLFAELTKAPKTRDKPDSGK